MTAKIERIDYCSWEGDPAILVHYADGRIYGFTLYSEDKGWQEGHATDIATKAALQTKEQFDAKFGSPTLPAFPD